jgi:3-hydroxyacyl-CoA dehydrogenase/3-hydroxy-2-methylbutyryl-CoA dehydrogenase
MKNNLYSPLLLQFMCQSLFLSLFSIKGIILISTKGSNHMDLKNNIALVTGGASGLGRGTVEHFVSKGCKVAILDINDEKAKEVINLLGAENVVYFNTDVMNEDSVKSAVNGIKENFGKLNFIVNCAGTGYGARILGKNGPHPLDIFKFIIDLNLVGTFNVMRLGAELIDANDPDDKGEKGVVINTASIAGYEGQIGQSAYAASKAGVIGMTLTSARDLARHSIRVCTIAPGIFDTPLMALAKDENKEALLKSTQFPHRFGDVKEYAQLAEHIVNNTYLNGETIRLDSAMRMEAK